MASAGNVILPLEAEGIFMGSRNGGGGLLMVRGMSFEVKQLHVYIDRVRLSPAPQVPIGHEFM